MDKVSYVEKEFVFSVQSMKKKRKKKKHTKS